MKSCTDTKRGASCIKDGVYVHLTAKELDCENGLDSYDSQARWYAPQTGRTSTIDPMAEKYPHLSPYLWCAANPITLTDPDGRDGVISGKGTNEDPYIIQANYYYNIGGVSTKEVDCLLAALSIYNNNGQSRAVSSDKGLIYVKFDLKLKPCENGTAKTEASKDVVEPEQGPDLIKGNYVGREELSPNGNGATLGSGSSFSVIIASNLDDYAKKNGFDSDKLRIGTFLHEIGHNFGLEDNEPGSALMKSDTKEKNIPSLDGNSILLLIKYSKENQ